MNTKKIEIDGKEYKLKVNRSIIKTLNSVAPDLLKTTSKKTAKEIEGDETAISAGLDIFVNLHVVFHDMLKHNHPEITLDGAEDLLNLFEAEYDGVQESLINFAMSVFNQGDQKKKKKITW